jgi:hypothetical protein
MDTTKRPSITVYETSPTWLGDPSWDVTSGNCLWFWSSLTNGYFKVYVSVNKDGRYDSIAVDFREFTDISGNLLDPTGTGLGIKSYKTR